MEADGQLYLTATVLGRDGKRRIEATAAGDPAHCERLGRQVAEDLLAQGAAELIACREKANSHAPTTKKPWARFAE